MVVLRGLRVTGVRQGPDGVQVTARGRQGQVTCTARYAVGADGARSTVRGQAAFACRTYPATVSALAGDVRLAEPGALRAGWHRTAAYWIVVKDIPDIPGGAAADPGLHRRAPRFKTCRRPRRSCAPRSPGSPAGTCRWGSRRAG